MSSSVGYPPRRPERRGTCGHGERAPGLHGVLVGCAAARRQDLPAGTASAHAAASSLPWPRSSPRRSWRRDRRASPARPARPTMGSRCCRCRSTRSSSAAICCSSWMTSRKPLQSRPRRSPSSSAPVTGPRRSHAAWRRCWRRPAEPARSWWSTTRATARPRPVTAQFAGVGYVHEPRPGLSVARNAGVRASKGALIAFTDDDVEPSPNWTTEIVRAFSSAAVDAVTGLVLPARLDTPAQCYFQFKMGGFGSECVPLIFDRRFLDETKAMGAQVWRIGAGANMAFRRSVFERVGLFDERLGAGASGCSEDSELWYRLLAAGGACLFEPRAVVVHHHREQWRGAAPAGQGLHERPRLRPVRAGGAASPWRQHPPHLRPAARLFRAFGLLGAARWRRCAPVPDSVGRDGRLAVRPAIRASGRDGAGDRSTCRHRALVGPSARQSSL